jgi:predicted dehydrogenase
VVPKKLGFGMIGLGEIAYKSTGGVMQKTAKAEMIAGVDPVEHIARSYQERFEIPCYTELDDVLNHPGVEAVIVTFPARRGGKIWR